LVVVAREGAEVASWPLVGGDQADLAVVDELAQMALAARRAGYSVMLRDVDEALSELLGLVGLREVLIGGLDGQGRREPELGEQAGVEEVVVPDDPVA
jgi:hypothetical protein